jgi:GH25 family lysozyme M1 (1,4-beta-N-acetylmuramidase)
LVEGSLAQFEGASVGRVEYAIVRSSDGLQTRRNSKPDPMGVRNLQGAHEAGLLVGVYHFVRAFHDAAEQVDLILDVIRTAGVPIGFVALDIEGRPDDPTTPDTDESSGAWWVPDDAEGPVTTAHVLELLVDMKQRLEARGHRVILYSGVAWHWQVGQKGIVVPRELSGVELWTPYYSKSLRPRMPIGPSGQPWPWREWSFWQFAGSQALPGRVSGIQGSVDLNRFRGDLQALRDFWTLPKTIPATFDPVEVLALAERAKLLGAVEASEELRQTYERIRKGGA